MANTETPTTSQVRCAAPGCGRILRNAQSIARGFGPTCYRRHVAAVKALALTTKPAQMEAAIALIRERKIERIGQDLYSVLSSDAHTVYYIENGECGCPAGHFGRQCKHLVARNALELIH